MWKHRRWPTYWVNWWIARLPSILYAIFTFQNILIMSSITNSVIKSETACSETCSRVQQHLFHFMLRLVHLHPALCSRFSLSGFHTVWLFATAFTLQLTNHTAYFHSSLGFVFFALHKALTFLRMCMCVPLHSDGFHSGVTWSVAVTISLFHSVFLGLLTLCMDLAKESLK